MTIEAARTFPEISSKAYEHPADRAATSALHAIPLMDRLLKRLSEIGLERRYRQVLLGNAVRLGSDQVPEVWELHTRCAARLDIPPPLLYVTQTPVVNGMTIGASKPIVVVSSALVSGFERADLHVVLGHELGHVLSEHYYYTGALNLLAQVVTSGFPLAALAGLPLRALYLVLLEWARAAELSSDRASALVLEDPLATCGALMRIAGGSLPGLNLQAFLVQASEYEEEQDLFSRRARFGIELSQSHPFAVRRAKELTRWVSSGEYNRVISGSYVRRGEEPPVSAEFDAAVEHYRQRFAAMLERTAGGVNRLAGQIQAWLRRNSAGAGDAGRGADGE